MEIKNERRGNKIRERNRMDKRYKSRENDEK